MVTNQWRNERNPTRCNPSSNDKKTIVIRKVCGSSGKTLEGLCTLALDTEKTQAPGQKD